MISDENRRIARRVIVQRRTIPKLRLHFNGNEARGLLGNISLGGILVLVPYENQSHVVRKMCSQGELLSATIYYDPEDPFMISGEVAWFDEKSIVPEIDSDTEFLALGIAYRPGFMLPSFIEHKVRETALKYTELTS